MSLILFNKSTLFMDKYTYEEGVTYEVPQRLQVKFCEQLGVAVEVQKDDVDDVQPNPSAEMYDGEDVVTINEPPLETELETKPEPTPEPIPVIEVSEDVDASTPPLYELKRKGGPWWNVVDVATGTAMNDNPLKKVDAEAMLNELLDKAASTPEVTKQAD